MFICFFFLFFFAHIWCQLNSSSDLVELSYSPFAGCEQNFDRTNKGVESSKETKHCLKPYVGFVFSKGKIFELIWRWQGSSRVRPLNRENYCSFLFFLTPFRIHPLSWRGAYDGHETILYTLEDLYMSSLSWCDSVVSFTACLHTSSYFSKIQVLLDGCQRVRSIKKCWCWQLSGQWFKWLSSGNKCMESTGLKWRRYLMSSFLFLHVVTLYYSCKFIVGIFQSKPCQKVTAFTFQASMAFSPE